MRLVTILFGLTLLSACRDGTEPSALESSAQARAPELFAADIGEVSFPVSCSDEAAKMAQRGLALLHHMMYEEARLLFGMAANLEPDCAMAYWGQAMTWVHPLWPDQPSERELRIGRELLDRADAASPRTVREAGYIRAARAYFDAQPGDNETDRLARFNRAWTEVAEQNPGDLEARTLAALALIATASFDDKTYAVQQRAADMLQTVLKEMPDHPGAHHYYIHAFDNPANAQAVLSIADRYGALTPVVPHATHMMTHIYTRLGAWRKSIEWNRKSADAAWEICTESGVISGHYTHALDYLAYAYLQIGADEAAQAAVEEAAAVSGPFSELNPDASAYALAAMPARYALERRDWKRAAALIPRVPTDFPWGPQHAGYEAITYFARALGRAHLGDTAAARADVEELRRLADGLRNWSPYWAQQVDIQIGAASAWIAQAEGDPASALEAMQVAADLEAGTEKSPVTPGEVLPARELLGDLHLLQDHPESALAAYRASLARSPKRLNSVLGAEAAARAAGMSDAAAHYRAELVAFVDPRTNRQHVVSLLNSAGG